MTSQNAESLILYTILQGIPLNLDLTVRAVELT